MPTCEHDCGSSGCQFTLRTLFAVLTSAVPMQAQLGRAELRAKRAEHSVQPRVDRCETHA